MQLVIVAGGKGTRLRERLGDLPKPMVDIAGKPLLEHLILLGRRHGFEDVLLLLGHGAQAILDYVGDGSRWGARIQAVVEDCPRGSAGAVLAAYDKLAPRFAVLYADTMANIDLARFWRAHQTSGSDASLLLHPNDHPADSDLVETGQSGRIIAFHPYPHDSERFYPNLVNAALYIVEKRALEPWRAESFPLDFGRDLFPAMLARGLFLYGYRSREYIKDAGTPHRLDAVLADYYSGRIARGSLEMPAPAIFLDRDGTLNTEVSYISRAEDLVLLDDAVAAIHEINKSGFLAVVVTNQPVVARGECDERQLAAIHNKLETLLGEQKAYLDAIYVCPHHPDKGYAGERPELKFVCACRKPATGLIERAREDLNIDLSRSWLIGDSTVDVRTARNAGLRSILVETGHAGKDARYPDQPDYRTPSLTAAVRLALDSRNGRLPG